MSIDKSDMTIKVYEFKIEFGVSIYNLNFKVKLVFVIRFKAYYAPEEDRRFFPTTND